MYSVAPGESAIFVLHHINSDRGHDFLRPAARGLDLGISYQCEAMALAQCLSTAAIAPAMSPNLLPMIELGGK